MRSAAEASGVPVLGSPRLGSTCNGYEVDSLIADFVPKYKHRLVLCVYICICMCVCCTIIVGMSGRYLPLFFIFYFVAILWQRLLFVVAVVADPALPFSCIAFYTYIRNSVRKNGSYVNMYGYTLLLIWEFTQIFNYNEIK